MQTIAVGLGSTRRRGPARRPRRVGEAAAAFAETFADPGLRRAQISFALIWSSEWALTVALAVIAFRHGGAAAVGVVATLRMLPAALLAPLGAALADRLPRERILVVAGIVRAFTVGAAAATVAAGLPVVWTYALAVLATAAFTVVRPAHSALQPALCRTPRQLTAATVVRGMMDSLGTLLGPLLATAGLALASPAAVLAAVAACAAWSAVLIARVHPAPQPPVQAPARRFLGREAAEGFTALVRHRDACLVIALALAQTFTRGCLGVLTVVMAIELLGSGEAGVGLLTIAIGAGAVLGSLAAGLLADGRNLARWEGVGAALWGLPLLACAVLPFEPAVLCFLAAVGVGNALVDVGLFTLPARIVPDAVLGRVFGVFESLVALTVALGSLAAPLLVHLLGIHGALLAAGALCPLCVLLAWPRLGRIDRDMVRRDDELALLRRLPMPDALPLPAVEALLARVERSVIAPGADLREDGDGGRTYVIASGTAEILSDGRVLRAVGPGDLFGDAGPTRERPRAAIVRATSELHLRALRREDVRTLMAAGAPAAELAAAAS